MCICFKNVVNVQSDEKVLVLDNWYFTEVLSYKFTLKTSRIIKLILSFMFDKTHTCSMATK